ncbi:MAG: glycosyl transferase group 1 [uncultured bacterium]|nr:MAG: glycosyl transferase group 1 [uncultured bacterium]HBY73719.1 hypothetical protein [Candidatus Kerfeldbacteria bacterium]
MRLGIDARSLLELHPSGVSVYTTQLLHALCTLPDRTDTICLYTSGWNVPTERIKPFLDYPQVEWHHLRVPNKLATMHLTPRIDRVLQSVDVLFVPNWNFLSVTKHCPVVLTVHDSSVALYPHLLSVKQRWWHRLIRPAAQLRRATRSIAVSETTRRDCIAQFGLNPNTITTIYSGPPTPVAPVPVAHLPKDYLVVIGTGGGRKNIEFIQQAALPLPVVVIGDTAGGYGYVSDGEKWYILQHAQALLYVSLYEGFGFPPLEAWQVGVPVIASAAGAIPEICGQAAFYVNPYSSSDLGSAVGAVLSDHILRSQLITAGQERLKQFQWEKTARQTLQVLRQAVY